MSAPIPSPRSTPIPRALPPQLSASELLAALERVESKFAAKGQLQATPEAAAASAARRPWFVHPVPPLDAPADIRVEFPSDEEETG